MRYDADTALRLTLQRAAALRARSYRRRGAALSAGTGVCFCALLGLGYALAARPGVALGEADYGAFLLPSQAGGYVLAAVLAFVAGVLVTLLCFHFRNSGADPPAHGAGDGPGVRTAKGEPTEHSDLIDSDPSERSTSL